MNEETEGHGGVTRVEAFSDGVIAIIITIMVLELRVPEEPTLEDLSHSATSFLTYLLSFVYIGIYWNNHHHLIHAATRVSGGMLWANLNFLFWLSLFPFATGWMGQNHFEALPSAVYGVVLLMAAIAYYVLQRCIIATSGPRSALKRAVGTDWKGKLPPLLYISAIVLSFWANWVAQALYVLVALMWLVPDRRLEHAIDAAGS